jgi:hypothetical protein
MTGLSVRDPDPAGFGAPAVTDWNGDGYSDLVVTVAFRDSFGVRGSILVVYHGSPSGLGARPQSLMYFDPPIRRSLVATVSDLGDVDLDGYGDVYVRVRLFSRNAAMNGRA